MLGLDEARAIVARHFRVYDARQERIQGDAQAQLFYLMFPAEEFDRRFEAARAELRARDPELVVFVRREGGEDVLLVAERPVAPPTRYGVHATLLGLTILTTMSAGAFFWASYTTRDAELGWSALIDPHHLLWGFVTFALPLLLILGLHETAHSIAARRHGLRATLPYFLPVPPFILPIGTLGAFISMRDPMPDRRALFDIGASGPIAGFLVAVPVVVLGVFLTGMVGMEMPAQDQPVLSLPAGFERVQTAERGIVAAAATDLTARDALLHVEAPPDTDSWSYELAVRVTTPDGTLEDSVEGTLDEGGRALHRIEVPPQATAARIQITWDDGLIEFGDPLLVKLLAWGGLRSEGFLTHPTYFAGWVGLLVTGINLLPVGQLDGGHVARAVFGDRMRFVAYATIGFLMFLVIFMRSWVLMALFILLIGIQHPPPLNDRTKLDKTRAVWAALVLVVFVLTFVAQPIIP